MMLEAFLITVIPVAVGTLIGCFIATFGTEEDPE